MIARYPNTSLIRIIRTIGKVLRKNYNLVKLFKYKRVVVDETQSVNKNSFICSDFTSQNKIFHRFGLRLCFDKAQSIELNVCERKGSLIIDFVSGVRDYSRLLLDVRFEN